MLKYLFIFIIICSELANLNAQSIQHRWILNFGNSYTDFHLPAKDNFSNRFTSSDWMGAHVPMSIRVGRRLNNSFTFGIHSSATQIEPAKLNTIPLDETITSDFFWKAGARVEYKFANGYLLNTSSTVDPYLLVGANATSINDKIHFSQSFGLGISLWITHQVGLNFQSSYDHISDFNDYMHYTFGVVARVGNMADRDRDLVPNKLDKCPKVAGLKSLDGCPDYDGDGITDSLDACPRVYGVAESSGCPDFDRDGVPDQEDQCPCDPGPFRYSGCPDSDGDGIIDKNDRCPFEKGIPETGGCPESPLPDSRDEMPEMLPVTGTAEESAEKKKSGSVELSPEPKPEMLQLGETTPAAQYRYHIIVGSYEDLGNALKRKTELELKGYRPRLLGQDRNRFHRLSIGSYVDYDTAKQELKYIRERISADAWLLTE